MSEAKPLGEFSLEEKSAIDLEKIEKNKKLLSDCLRYVEWAKEEEGTLHYNVPQLLAEAGEKELAINAFKIVLYENTHIIQESYKQGEKFYASNKIHHDPAHVQDVYTDSIMKISQGNMGGVDILGRELVKLRALAHELNGNHQEAAAHYEKIGEVERAKEELDKPDEKLNHKDELVQLNQDTAWKSGVEEFIKKAEESNPFKSQEERDAEVENLGVDMQNKINEIS